MPSEHSACLACHLQNSGSVGDLATVGLPVLMDGLGYTVLLVSPVRRHAVEVGGGDPPVQLVEIHGVEALLDDVVLRLKPRDGFIVELLLVDIALAQSGGQVFQRRLREGHAVEQCRDVTLDDLLPRVARRTFAAVAGAAQVVIATLVALGDHRASAMAAADQAGEQELMLSPLWVNSVAPVEHVLDAVPEVSGEKCLMCTAVRASVPDEVAAVEPVSQDVVDRRRAHGCTALAEGQAPTSRQLCHLLH
ncbi:MAG TPA: hypothetical protein VNG93_14595 [Candidatus Dormibacteraeota bacterium]|nr:hypothetical protein [Candidatus Dormibacteraeota bacterium]